MVDNRGFVAVVDAVERLRNTTGSLGSRQLGVGRQRYRAQLDLIAEFQDLKRTIAGERGLGGATKHEAPRRNEKGQFVKQDNTRRNEKEQFVQSTPKIEVKAAIDFDPLVSKLSKAIASEIRRQPLRIQTGFLEKVGQGLFQGLGNQFVKGLDRGTKKNIGINTESVGYGVGNFATNPVAGVKDAIKARRSWQTQNAALRDALLVADNAEKIKLDENRENVFTIGGVARRQGRAGSYVGREIKKEFGNQNVKTITVENPNTDVSLDMETIKGVYAALKKANIDNVTTGNIINGLQGLRFAVGQIDSMLVRGYNPDASQLAGQVIAAKRQNPQAKISLAGHSFGGLVVEEALAILQQAGITDVAGFGIATPDLGVGFNQQNYQSFFGEKDYVGQDMAVQVMRPDLLPEPQRLTDEENAKLGGHGLPQYLKHSAVAGALSSRLRPATPNAVQERLVGEASQQAKDLLSSIEGLNGPELDQLRSELLLLSNSLDAVNADPLNISPLQQAIAVLQEGMAGLSVTVDQLRQGLESLQAPLEQMGGRKKGTPLSRQYADRLSGIVDSSQRSAGEKVRTLIPNFKDMNLSQKRDTAAQYNKGLQGQVKAYRQAVQDGDRQLAAEIGEKLLADAQTVDQVYGDLLAALPSDYVGTKSLQSQRNQVKRIQNEVLKGDKGAGRVPVGLPDLVAESEGLAASGDNAAQSFIDSVQGKLAGVQSAGVGMGEALKAGVDESLDMHSPSEEMKDRGKNAGDSFGMGAVESLRDAGNAISAEVERIKDSIDSQVKDVLNMDFFHGTSTTGARSIRKQGIDIDRTENMMFGQGFYLSNDYTDAESFALTHKFEGRKPAVLKGRLKSKNPWVTTEDEYNAFMSGAIQRGELKEADRPEDYSQQKKEEKELIQKQGFDSLFIKDRGWAVAFEPDQVEFENLDEVGRNAVESLIASIKRFLGKLRGTGESVGDALKDGVDDSLDMHSPSEEMRKRGEMAGEGFKIGAVESLRDAGNAISAEIERIKAVLDRDLEYLRAVATGDTAKAQAMVDEAAKAHFYKTNPIEDLDGNVNVESLQALSNPPFYAVDKNPARSSHPEVNKAIQEIKEISSVAEKFLDFTGEIMTGTIEDMQSLPSSQLKRGKGESHESTKGLLGASILEGVFLVTDKQGNLLAGKENAKEIIVHESAHRLQKNIPDSMNEEWENIHSGGEKNEFAKIMRWGRMVQQGSGDIPVTEYGQSKPEEDFAESAVRHVLGKNLIQESHPAAVWDGSSRKQFFEKIDNWVSDVPDAVTKTDDGKPVPLSARFDDSVSDIRGNVNDIFAGLKSQAGEALQPLIAELETQFAAMGDNSVQSLIDSLEGLLGQLRGTGESVGDALAQGTEEALQIKSPSKVFAAIGESIIAGLDQGLTGFEGTLKEKRKLLETYVKSVIELIYDFKKVTGEAETPAQEVRKLFQEIGKAGNATPEQLTQAKGYFPQLGILANGGIAGASYDVLNNKILAREKASINDFIHEYTHALQFNLKGLPPNQEDYSVDELTRFLPSLSLSGWKELQKKPMPPRIAGGVKSSADHYVSLFPSAPPTDRDKLRTFAESIESEAYANAEGIESKFNRRKELRFSKRPFFRADAESVAPQIKQQKIRNRLQKQFDRATEDAPDKENLRSVFDFALLGYDTNKKSFNSEAFELAEQALSTEGLENYKKALSDIGINVTDSLTQSIEGDLGDVKDSGAAIGKALSQGTEDALQIDSPSKVYKAIGKDVIAGLDQGLEGFEGTLEEKRKLLETYVKSVIEVVYDLPKVTGEAVTPAEKVRKLFQDIGKTGTATTAQLEEAKGYFPNLKQLPAGSPAAAVYQVRENKIVIDPKRGEQLPEDLIHEYTHAMQSRFGVGSRWANKPQDYLRYQGVLGRRAEMGDPRVKQAAGRSAQAFMGQMRIDETDRRYQEGFDHIAAAEAEAYGNELGIGKERQRRGFFRAEAEEMAQQFRALKAQAKRQAAEAKQTAAAVGKGFADGYEEGRKAILERVNGFLDWLEGIPLLGQLVKWGRGIAGAIAGLFVQKEKATKGKSEPNPVQKTTREAIRNVINQNRPEKPKPKPKKKDAVDAKEVETTTPAIANVPEVKTVIENNSHDLADKWLAYVVQWSKQIGTQFEDFLDQEIQQVKASGGNVKDALTGILDPIREELDERKKVFRQAIADGDTQLAHAMAERLIKQAEELRIGYKKLAENVKFFEGRGQYRDQSAEMTKTQREAAGGYPNLKGRTKTGAWQAIAESTSDGFTEGIEGELKEAENSGYDLGEAAIKGAKKALGIKSPSREFYEMALQVVQGWNMGMEELGGDGENNIVQFIRQVDQGVAGGIDKIKEGFSGLFSKVGEAFPIFGQLKNLILGFGAAMILENVFTMAVQGFGAMAAGAFDTVIAFESLNRAFVAISGSSAKAETNLQFVANTAKKLGVDLKTAEDAYLGLLSTTRGTALEGTQTQQIFEVFSQTASVRGLSNEEQGRMFAALQQSLSKQKMSAEEVRGQLGEIAALDFQGTLARSLGVSVAQLDDLMSSGELLASDVMPKIAAQYAAENAVVANSSETTAQAIARYQNSLEQFRRSLSSWFDEAKFVFNGMAALIEWFTSAMPTVIQMVSALVLYRGLVLAWETTSLLVSFAKTATAGSVFKSAIAATISVLKSALPVIGTYLGQIILIQLAIDAVTAAFNVSQDRFDEFTKSLDTAKKSTDELERALDKLNKTGSETKPPTLPTEGKGVVTDQTWKPFGVETGVNLEGVRQGLGIRTLGEKQMLDFQVNVGDSVTNAYRTLGKQVPSEKLVGDVTAINEEINKVRNRRANLIKGDTEQYSKTVEEEKKLLKQREELFKGTSAYATALDNDITNLKQGLADLDELVARDGITTDAEASTRSAMETALADLEKTKQRYDDLTNSLQKSLSFLERQMRNLNEQYAAFNENLNRQATNNRVRFLRQATSQGMGTTVQGLGLGSLDSQATQERIVFLRKQVEEINGYLTEPKTAKLLEELAEQAKLEGTDLNNSATLDRLINDISPDSGERKSVAVMLKRMLEIQDELGQSEEQLAQSLLDQKNGLFDLNRSIQDFFQQLTLQIEETRLEIERVKNQMKYGRIRQKLQQAIAPGSNTFMNGIIGTIQGIFDQAGQLMEKAIGQKSSLLQFGSEKYSLENQMLDFGRSVNGATQAVEAFKAALGMGNAVLDGGQGASGGTVAAISPDSISLAVNAASKFNGIVNMCAAAVKAFTDKIGINTKAMDLTADSSKRVGKVMTDFSKIKPGDIIGWSGGSRFGDEHVGVYLGGQKVFHQSGSRGKKVGVYDDLEYFKKQKGAYFVRPSQSSFSVQTVATQGRSPSGMQTGKTRTAKASFYGGPTDPTRWHGRKTASGEVYDENGLTVAVPWRSKTDKRPSIPFGTYLLVTNPANGKQVVVRVTDTGNFGTDQKYAAYGGLDLSYGAAKALGTIKAGVATVNYQVVTSGGQSQPVATNVSYQASNQPDPAVQKAKADTATLVGLKKAVVDGNAELLNQEFKDFRINSAAEMLGAGVQLDQELRNLGNDVADLRNQFADLDDQYSPQTLSRQAAAENRQVENQLRQLTNQLTEREIVLKQAIATMKDFAPALREASSQLGIAPEAAANMRGLADRLESEFLPVYQKALAETQNYQAQLEPLRAKMQEFNQLQQAIRQTNQDAELAALKAQAAAETRQDLLKRDAEIERANVEFKKQSLELSTRLEGEELDKQLKYHEQIRDAQIETANYEYESLLRARELEIVQGKLAIAVFNGNLEQQLKLELQQIELETLTEIARINREITDETTKQTMLAQTLETSQNRQKQAYFDDVNRRLELQNIERDLAARNAENRANLTTNPFEATAIREQQAIAARRAEFEQKAIELRQKYQGNPALAESLVSREAEILAQDLQLIDRQFRDVSETVGDMLSGAFNNFFTALINGENALQAFTNSLLQSITELGSQMLQQGLNGLFGGIFEGVIPGFASGGYTGNGDRLQPAGIVHAGEFVLNKKATQKIGLPTLNLLNRLPGYFDGGYVGLESRLLSGLNTYQPPRLSLPENGDRRGMAGATTNTVTVNINDKESRFYRQSRTLARELADELRG